MPGYIPSTGWNGVPGAVEDDFLSFAADGMPKDSGYLPSNFMVLGGVSGGQTAIGGTDSGDDLVLQSTSHATRGFIKLRDAIILGFGDTYGHLMKSSAAEELDGEDLRIGLDTSLNTFIVCPRDKIETDFGHGYEPDPTIFLYDRYGSTYLKTYIQGDIYFEGDGNSSFIFQNGFSFNLSGAAHWLSMDIDRSNGNFINMNKYGDVGLTDTNAKQAWLYLSPSVKQSDTAAFDGILLDATLTSLGDGSTGDGNNLFRLAISTVTKAKIDLNAIQTLSNIETILGSVSDGYTAGIKLNPGYTSATALTVTRHNYIDIQDVSVAGDGPAAVTNAAVLRFNADIGTHKSLADAFQTTDSDSNTTDWAGGITVNINDVMYKMPLIIV